MNPTDLQANRFWAYSAFLPPVPAGPAETSEVAVAGAHRREFGICRQLVVGVLAFLLGALHAEGVRVEATYCEAAVVSTNDTWLYKPHYIKM